MKKHLICAGALVAMVFAFAPRADGGLFYLWTLAKICRVHADHGTYGGHGSLGSYGSPGWGAHWGRHGWWHRMRYHRHMRSYYAFAAGPGNAEGWVPGLGFPLGHRFRRAAGRHEAGYGGGYGGGHGGGYGGHGAASWYGHGRGLGHGYGQAGPHCDCDHSGHEGVHDGAWSHGPVHGSVNGSLHSPAPTPVPSHPPAPARVDPSPTGAEPLVDPDLPQSPQPIHLDLRVPDNARVYINGARTASNGSFRRFVSHNLKFGSLYTYHVRAEFSRDGRTVSQSKTVVLPAGAQRQLSFELGQAVAQQPQTTALVLRVPEDAKVTLAGNEVESTGAVREFTTTNLDGGDWSNYPVRVQVVRDGRTLVQQRILSLRPGERKELTFDFDAAQVASNR